MGSESISTLIIFIASLLIAGAVANLMLVSFSTLSGVVDDRSDRTVERINTDIDIINDPDTEGTYDDENNELTLYVKNTGGERIPNTPDSLDLFINGEFYEPDNMEIQDGADWRPGNVAELTVSVDLTDGYHRTKIVVNSNEDVLEFYL